MEVRLSDPCPSCTRVPDPEKCEVRRCKCWEAWFLHRWEQIHGFYLKYLEENGGTL